MADSLIQQKRFRTTERASIAKRPAKAAPQQPKKKARRFKIVILFDDDSSSSNSNNQSENDVRPLTPAEETLVDDGLWGFAADTRIARRSFETLRPGRWLDDEAIHAYLELLTCRHEDSNKSAFYTSFFWTKLLREGHADPKLRGVYDYESVRHWSDRVPDKNLWDLDKLVVPIHINKNHWVCIVAYMKERRIQFYDSLGVTSGAWWLHVCFQYLQDEHEERTGCPLPNPDEWLLVENIQDVARQDNTNDCGVFVAKLVDVILQDKAIDSFSQKDIPRYRRWMALSILKGKIE